MNIQNAHPIQERTIHLLLKLLIPFLNIGASQQGFKSQVSGGKNNYRRLHHREFDFYFSFKGLGCIFQGSQAGDTHKMKMNSLAGDRK